MTLYKIHDEFGHFGYTLDEPIDSYYETVDYIIPEGYTVRESEDGGHDIYKGDEYCPLVGDAHRVCIVTYNGMVYLKPVGDSVLKAYRIAANLTQEQAAEKAGVNLRLWRKYETGECPLKNMTLGTAKKICDSMGCQIEELTE